MRPSLVVLVLLAAPAIASAQEKVVRMKVGETRSGFETQQPICDATSVAVLWNGTLRAVGEGETLCSAASIFNPGYRQVYRVIVTKPAPERQDEPKKGEEPAKREGPEPR